MVHGSLVQVEVQSLFAVWNFRLEVVRPLPRGSRLSGRAIEAISGTLSGTAFGALLHKHFCCMGPILGPLCVPKRVPKTAPSELHFVDSAGGLLKSHFLRHRLPQANACHSASPTQSETCRPAAIRSMLMGMQIRSRFQRGKPSRRPLPLAGQMASIFHNQVCGRSVAVHHILRLHPLHHRIFQICLLRRAGTCAPWCRCPDAHFRGYRWTDLQKL